MNISLFVAFADPLHIFFISVGRIVIFDITRIFARNGIDHHNRHGVLFRAHSVIAGKPVVIKLPLRSGTRIHRISLSIGRHRLSDRRKNFIQIGISNLLIIGIFSRSFRFAV